jgi:hypothetical protein
MFICFYLGAVPETIGTPVNLKLSFQNVCGAVILTATVSRPSPSGCFLQRFVAENVLFDGSG